MTEKEMKMIEAKKAYDDAVAAAGKIYRDAEDEAEANYDAGMAAAAEGGRRYDDPSLREERMAVKRAYMAVGDANCKKYTDALASAKAAYLAATDAARRDADEE